MSKSAVKIVRTIQEVALRAIELNLLIKAATEELEEQKEILRGDAEAAPWRELVTSAGSVRAAFVEPAIGPRKGKDGAVSLTPALEGLAADHFALLFSSKTVVSLDCKDTVTFAERLRLLDRDERALVATLVEEKPAQVRITLPAGKKLAVGRRTPCDGQTCWSGC